MEEPANEPVPLLTDARAGSPEALGQALEAFRGYLLLIAQQELDAALQAKGGASDLVQETLLDALRAFSGFHGHGPDELRAWLRRILLNNLVSFTRRYRETDKRQVGQEIALPGSSAGGGLAASGPSPSHQAMQLEQGETVRRVLEQLPEDYRRVLTLRYQEDRTFEEIGRLLERTPNAARKLLLRALERVQQELKNLP